MKVMKSSDDNTWKTMALRLFEGSARDFADLARVSNETLEATTLPGEFKAASPDSIRHYYNNGNGNFDLSGNAWLISLREEPVAAAILYPQASFRDRPPGNFHLYVVPRMWRNGLGARLLDHLEQAAHAREYPTLETTIAAEDGQSTRFLLARGFRVVGQSYHLARPNLRDLPPITVPSGYSVTTIANPGDSADLYRETANRLGAHDSNYTLVTAEELAEQIRQGDFDPTGVLFLSEPLGRIVGVIRAKYDQQRGYLSEIRLEPSSRGQGLGTVLVFEALHYLAQRGAKRAELDTHAENTAAVSLAQRTGFTDVRHWLHFLKSLDGLPKVTP